MRGLITAASQSNAKEAGYKFYGLLNDGHISVVYEKPGAKLRKTLDIDLLPEGYKILYNFTNDKGEQFRPVEAKIMQNKAPEDFKLIDNLQVKLSPKAAVAA